MFDDRHDRSPEEAYDLTISMSRDADRIDPARKVVRRSAARRTHKVMSMTMGVAIQAESMLERRAIAWYDVVPEVIGIHAQPMEIGYTLAGRRRKHIPDLLLEYVSGLPDLIEIKEVTAAKDPETVARTRALAEPLKRLGYVYRVMSPDVELSDTQVENARMVARWARDSRSPEGREAVRQQVRQRGGSVSWTELLTSATMSVARCDVCWMIWAGDLVVDYTVPCDSWQIRTPERHL